MNKKNLLIGTAGAVVGAGLILGVQHLVYFHLIRIFRQTEWKQRA